MTATTIYTEGKGADRLFITREGDEFVTSVYRNGEGKPELIGRGHDMRSAMAFVTLHRPRKARARKAAGLAEMQAWLAR